MGGRLKDEGHGRRSARALVLNQQKQGFKDARALIKPLEKLVISKICETRKDLCFDNKNAMLEGIDKASSVLKLRGLGADTDWRIVKADAPVSDVSWKKEGMWSPEEVEHLREWASQSRGLRAQDHGHQRRPREYHAQLPLLPGAAV